MQIIIWNGLDWIVCYSNTNNQITIKWSYYEYLSWASNKHNSQ